MMQDYVVSLLKYEKLEKLRVKVHLVEVTYNTQMFGSILVVHPELLALIGYPSSNIEIAIEDYVLKDPYRRS